MKRRLCRMPTLLALAAVASLGAETVTLTYSPAEGGLFVVTETVERVTVRGESDPVTDFRERISLVRVNRTEAGYSNEATILAVFLTKNGHPVSSPVHAAMPNLVLTQSLGSDGNLIEIGGYDNLADAMRESLPEPLAKTMIPLVNPEALQRQDESAYRRVYGGIPGSGFEPGAPQVSGGGHALPFGGSVPLFSVDILEVPEGEGEAPRLTSRFSTDAAALASEFEGIEESALRAACGAATSLRQGVVSASVQGSRETHLDFEGLLVSDQNATYEFALTLAQNSGAPVQLAISETHSFSARPATEADLQQVP